jgi:threonine dehydrogenase-like Zn-dependent dehydrogenase
MGFVGVTHDVTLNGIDLFFTHVHVHGGPAPVRRFLPDLLDRIWAGKIQPGKVFDMAIPFEQAADGYRAQDTRQAIKVLLWP